MFRDFKLFQQRLLFRGQKLQKRGMLLLQSGGVFQIGRTREVVLNKAFQGVVKERLHQVSHKFQPPSVNLKFNCGEVKIQSQEVIMEIFAERLKELRKASRQTSKEMAEYLGVSQRAYLYYESATHYPDVPGLLKLANYFGVTTDYLLGRSDSRT